MQLLLCSHVRPGIRLDEVQSKKHQTSAVHDSRRGKGKEQQFSGIPVHQENKCPFLSEKKKKPSVVWNPGFVVTKNRFFFPFNCECSNVIQYK